MQEIDRRIKEDAEGIPVRRKRRWTKRGCFTALSLLRERERERDDEVSRTRAKTIQ